MQFEELTEYSYIDPKVVNGFDKAKVNMYINDLPPFAEIEENLESSN